VFRLCMHMEVACRRINKFYSVKIKGGKWMGLACQSQRYRCRSRWSNGGCSQVGEERERERGKHFKSFLMDDAMVVEKGIDNLRLVLHNVEICEDRSPINSIAF